MQKPYPLVIAGGLTYLELGLFGLGLGADMRFVVVVVFFTVCWLIVALVLTSMRLHKARRELAKLRGVPTNSSESEGETYGHPMAPVKAVYDALPSPPPGYAWEVFTQGTELVRGEQLHMSWPLGPTMTRMAGITTTTAIAILRAITAVRVTSGM